MQDDFHRTAVGMSDPAVHLEAITPSDSTDLARVTRALWVGQAGDLAVVSAAGESVTLPNAEGLIPIRVTRVRATGTTATGLVGLS
ncbi:spike base protein, RCAP_Rcc01079 family [Phaeovulum vinaykumarii]|uniref:Uncharacterized protein n=1 Tax=Phaeovulum vinaykumarii TaxID=407234 RepID=A0A1N7MFE1_9RHOB|nr:hypothetical protein [Phaeovulum vinaykumarii]SIS84845.1 hypothetical protein SAMN05421795_10759 [Phaeovulum vinaykumarii]SOC11970.1 hypothetical protein SAMN05878426_10759 [Phaeovulum vinaykumarii]